MAIETRVQCPACGATFPAGAHYCPSCGVAITETPLVASAIPAPPPSTVLVTPPVRESNWGAWAAVLLLAILVLGAIGLMLWRYGYAENNGEVDVTRTAPPTNITVENSPRASSTTPPPATEAPRDERPPAVTPPAVPNPEIVSVSAKATDTNPTEWTYDYTVKLRNNANQPVRADVLVKFLDSQGFVLDDDVLDNAYVPANSEATFEDYDLIKSDIAMRVATVKAIIR